MLRRGVRLNKKCIINAMEEYITPPDAYNKSLYFRGALFKMLLHETNEIRKIIYLDMFAISVNVFFAF